MSLLTSAGIWFGASALIALAWPVAAWRRAARGSAGRRRAGCFALASVWLAIVTACCVMGVSFAWHPASVTAVLLAYLCAGALAFYAFRLPSLWLLLPVGLSCVLAWLAAGPLLLFANKDAVPITVQLDGAMVCRSSSQEVFLGPSMRELVLYRRYLLLDIEAARRGFEDALVPVTDWPPVFAAAFESCYARSEEVRSLKREAAPAPPPPSSKALSSAVPAPMQTRQSPPPASR